MKMVVLHVVSDSHKVMMTLIVALHSFKVLLWSSLCNLIDIFINVGPIISFSNELDILTSVLLHRLPRKHQTWSWQMTTLAQLYLLLLKAAPFTTIWRPSSGMFFHQRCAIDAASCWEVLISMLQFLTLNQNSQVHDLIKHRGGGINILYSSTWHARRLDPCATSLGESGDWWSSCHCTWLQSSWCGYHEESPTKKQRCSDQYMGVFPLHGKFVHPLKSWEWLYVW